MRDGVRRSHQLMQIRAFYVSTDLQPFIDVIDIVNAFVRPGIAPAAFFVQLYLLPLLAVSINVNIQILRPSAPDVIVVIPLLIKGIGGGRLHLHLGRGALARCFPTVRAGDANGSSIVERIDCSLFHAALGIGCPDIRRLSQLSGAARRHLSEVVGEQPGGGGTASVRRGVCPAVCRLNAQHDAAVFFRGRISKLHTVQLIADCGARYIPTHIAVILSVSTCRQDAQKRLRNTARYGSHPRIVFPRAGVQRTLCRRCRFRSGMGFCLDGIARQRHGISAGGDQRDLRPQGARFLIADDLMGYHVTERALNHHLGGCGKRPGIGDDNVVAFPSPCKAL